MTLRELRQSLLEPVLVCGRLTSANWSADDQQEPASGETCMKYRRVNARWMPLVLATTAVLAVSGCATSDDGERPAPVSEPSDTETSEITVLLPDCPAPECTQVYVITEETGLARLVPIPSTEDLQGLGNRPSPSPDVPLPPEAWVKDAVQELMETDPPNQLRSLWRGECAPADGVRAVEVTRQRITITLTSTPRVSLCDLSMESLRMQEQQVAWTATQAAGQDVPVVVEFERGADYFGGPVTADPHYLA